MDTGEPAARASACSTCRRWSTPAKGTGLRPYSSTCRARGLSRWEHRAPWDPAPAHVIGELARQRGPTTHAAGRVAKSWLSYGGANRTAAILPWGRPTTWRKCRGNASAAYLRHLAAAFDSDVAAASESGAAQQSPLTVPASFDGRRACADAARGGVGGLEHVTLLEKPQAPLCVARARGRLAAPGHRG